MGEFSDLTLSRVPPGIKVPEPIRMLIEWVDDSGFVTRGDDGDLYGSLSATWPLGPGTNVVLRGSPPEEADLVAAWGPISRDTVWPFCRTGGDGSQAALWKAPDGRTLVVHLGSGSGSILTCVLGNDPVDFLRLLAIGYDEICWNKDWHLSPELAPDHEGINEPYRRWVETTFRTTIPTTALELIPAPAEMGDTSDDAWCRWLNDATVEAVAASSPSSPSKASVELDDIVACMEPLF